MSTSEMRKLMEAISPRYENNNDFDWTTEMETGVVIHDNPKGGYDVTADGKHMGHFDESDEVLPAIKQWMEDNSYWPNIFFVNDHGNVSHIDSEGRELNSIVEKETKKTTPKKTQTKKSQAKKKKENPFPMPEPEMVTKKRAADALKGKAKTHNKVSRGQGGWTIGGRGYGDPIVGGEYSPGTEWKKLIAQPGTVTIYKKMASDPTGEFEQWDIAMDSQILTKAQSGTEAWRYLKHRFNTMIDNLVFVDEIGKDVMRLDPHSPTMERALENGSHDVKREMGDVNPNRAYGFQESISDLKEQFKQLFDH